MWNPKTVVESAYMSDLIYFWMSAWAVLQGPGRIYRRPVCIPLTIESLEERKQRHPSFFFYYCFIQLPSDNVLCVALFFSPASVFEAVSPWHEGRRFSLLFRLRDDLWVAGNSQRETRSVLCLPLSNYMTALRERGLRHNDPLMLPNIPFLFILKVFVQSRPLMLTVPSSSRHCKRGTKHKSRASSRQRSEESASPVSPTEGCVR